MKLRYTVKFELDLLDIPTDLMQEIGSNPPTATGSSLFGETAPKKRLISLLEYLPDDDIRVSVEEVKGK